ncbi:DNA-binding CsgD family transcriptional regulator [Actinokineospora baliensis]|uniref:ATP-binding protein n=1 Tax=Actinokineospora baliensis TaxID=547056 RepID=UPI00195C622E|nr:AAA family ATPase [Actinokineospora baliensis]MBM7773845.1 DNA-binding CsgD family transcriptional regulator [Actinokineospora baliensis]
MYERTPSLIGRQAEASALNRSFRAAAAGLGNAVLLVGEAGIGKSRLAQFGEAAAAESGMVTLRGRGSTLGPSVPYRPISEALMALHRGGFDLVDDLGPYRAILGSLMPDWSREGDVPPSGSVLLLAEAVLRLLAAVGRDRGCLLVLENLHEVDRETLAVVEYLADNIGRQPVAVLGTTRPEPGPALDLATSAARRGNNRLLRLGRLDRAEVGALVAAVLEVDESRLPVAAVDRIFTDSAGNPYYAEEILHEMVDSGLLAAHDGGWRLTGPAKPSVPESVVWAVARRAENLGEQGRSVLSAAAVLGHRFPLSVVQAMLGIDDRGLLRCLRASVGAQLVVADEPVPDWYAFRHPLTAEALLAQMVPAEQADMSRKAADAVELLHPGLPGPWCVLAAVLRERAGEPVRAGELFGEAGDRAFAVGAPGSAVELLERATALLAGHGALEAHAKMLVSLLPAVAEAGEFERARRLADGLATGTGTGVVDRRTRALLHVRLATLARLSGQWRAGIEQIDKARALLGEDPGEAETAQLDIVAAAVILEAPGEDRLRLAEELARQAVAAAERVDLPSVACQGWDLLGVLARDRDRAEAVGYFRRSGEIAEQHGLLISRIYASVRLAVDDWVADGTSDALRQARGEAMGAGAIVVVYNIDAMLALDAVLTGEFTAAEQALADCAAAVRRLQIDSMIRYTLMTAAVLAAHRGRRTEMTAALAELARQGGTPSPSWALSLGLAKAFCALLEEDLPQAERELQALAEAERSNPSTFQLTGRHGLALLLDVLACRADRAQLRRRSTSAPALLRWNRQFVELAEAVLHGRDGRPDLADAAMAKATATASLYPMAHHLGLRLVAAHAAADGWGAPQTWLRAAETYFYSHAITPVASACRADLRTMGAVLPARRTGTDRLPGPLRTLGVTAREYEVFELLAHRLSNKVIATRLHISHRTVEKHVAALITKTSRPSRVELCEYALELNAGTR